MKARKKGTQEWKEYKEVFGPYGEFIGLETLGYTKSVDEIISEMGIDVAEDPFARSRIQPQYMSAVLPLECFDLWEEPDWNNFCRLDLKPCKENCPLRKTREEMEQQKETRI